MTWSIFKKQLHPFIHSKYKSINNSVIKIMYIKYIVIPHSENYFSVNLNIFFHMWEEMREKERGKF